eukprot:TRINITY_DN635_c0_g2_i1.p1 TRINITY_DN635_c0_g2~~TRINITY_DN635_c0_g2_i1.p1  ORF type:complete len:155 (+),score=2.42 TRINITY_DN635_c0_g2_i1:500-964(+)
MQQRCDSPTQKRKMRISISLLDDPDFNLRRILYECFVYDEEERVIDIEDCGAFNFSFNRSTSPDHVNTRTTTNRSEPTNGTPPEIRISKLVEDLVIQCSMCSLIQTDPEVRGTFLRFITFLRLLPGLKWKNSYRKSKSLTRLGLVYASHANEKY